jgi:hypothetical protein
MNLPPKPIAGLKILLKGEDIELQGRKYCLQDANLYSPAMNLTTGQEVLMRIDMSLAEFITLCEKESDTIYFQGLEIN